MHEELVKKTFNIDPNDTVVVKPVGGENFRINILRKTSSENSTIYRFQNVGSYYVKIKDGTLTDLTIKK